MGCRVWISDARTHLTGEDFGLGSARGDVISGGCYEEAENPDSGGYLDQKAETIEMWSPADTTTSSGCLIGSG